MAISDSTTKTCSKCKQKFPATPEYFSQDRTRRDGLRCVCNSCRRKYYEANKEKISEQQREYREANKEKRREYSREYNQANKEKRCEYNREYHQTPRGKEVARTNSHRRRARKANAPIGLLFDEQAQLKRQKTRCYYCGCKLDEYHIDHVIPLSRGGADGAENKVLACPSCNLSKGSKLPSEWTEGGRLL